MVFVHWYRFGQYIEDKVASAFEAKGKFVARHPFAWITIFFAIGAVCAIGLMKLEVVVDTDKMWTPDNSEAHKDLTYIETTFGRKQRGGPVLFLATEQIQGNLVSLDAFETLWDVHEKVMNVTTSDGFTYNDICANRDPAGKCMVYGVLQYFNGNRTLYNIKVQNVMQLQRGIGGQQFPDGTGVMRDQIFSNYTLKTFPPHPPMQPQPAFALMSCLAMEQFYFIKQDPIEVALDWEREFVKALDGMGTSSVGVYRNANSACDDELALAARPDMPLMFLMYAIFVAMTFFTLSKRISLLDTRIGLSITGLALLLLSTAASFGICGALGVKMISTHMLIPFLVVCVGTTNMYLLATAFDAQDASLSVEERMGSAMRQCGKSLLYTALSASAAFYLGGVSRFFAVRSFCYYAGTAVFATYLLQVNAFTAALSLDARRRDAGKLDLLCCVSGGAAADRAGAVVVPTDSEAAVGIDEETAAQGPVDPAIAKYAPSEPAHGEAVPLHGTSPKPVAVVASAAAPFPATSKGSSPRGISLLGRFFSDVYFPIISLPAVRILLFLGFCGLLVANIFGTFQLRQEMDPPTLLPKDSFVREFIETARSVGLFAPEQSAPADIVLPFLDYHNQTIQERIFALQGTFVNQTEYNSPVMASWLTLFYRYARDPRLLPANQPPFNSDGYVTDESQFYKHVVKFLNTPVGRKFKADVLLTSTFAGDVTPIRIKASRIQGFHNNMRGPEKIVDTMRHTRRLVAEMDFPPGLDASAAPAQNFNSTLRTYTFVFAPQYIKAEGFKIAVPELFKVLIAACVGVAGVSALLLKPYGVTPVVVATVTIAATYVNIIGNFAYWGWEVDLNYVATSIIVMAIALMSAYILHTVQHYHAQPYTVPPLDRLRATLVQVGPAVLMACLTAWVAIIPMAFAESYIYHVFFRVFFCVIAYSLGHALVLLPAILPTLSYLCLDSCAADSSEAAAGLTQNGTELELAKRAAGQAEDVPADEVVPFTHDP